jgi:PGF-pre-PGF domain-containing protein
MKEFKPKIGKKPLAEVSLTLLFAFLMSYTLFLVEVNSQSSEASNSFGYLFLIFSGVVIVLTILALTKNPVADFLVKKFKVIVIVLIIIFLLIYFVPQIPIKPITGLFVVTPTTTSVVKEEVLPGMIQTFSEIQPGKTNTMKISGEGVSLTELNLDVYSKLKNVKIVVSKLTGKPISTMQDPPGNLYQYLKIEKTNIKDEDLKKVVIKFKVDKSWINNNKIDESTISLNRYQNNVWMRLSTAKTDADNEFVYYETYTTGLSFFAITGSTQQQGVTTTTTTVVTTTVLMGPLDITTTATTTIIPGTTTTTMPVTTSTIPHYDCKDSDTGCTLTTFTKTYADGSAMTVNYQKPVNFFNSSTGQYENVNRTIKSQSITISGRDYSFGVKKGFYEAYFRDMSSDVKDRPIAMVKNNYSLTFSPQGFILYVPHKATTEGRVGNRQQSSAMVSENQVTYPNQYAKVGTSGDFANLTYVYQYDQIKEELVIWDQNYLRNRFQSQCNVGDADIVNLVFQNIVRAYYSEDVDGQTLGVFYGSGRAKFKDFGLVANDEKTTSEEIYFTDESNDTVYYIPMLYAYDSNGSQILLNKTISMTNFNNLRVDILVPFSWLNSSERVYPVYIDPTTNTPYDKEIDYYSINNTLNGYYFNATNAEQRIYDTQDYWTKNDVCLGLYFGNRWHEFCGIDFDWVWYNSTNFTTYSNLTGTAELSYAGYTVDAKVEYYLGEDYPEVKGTVTLENVGNKDISDSYIKIKTHDINVNKTVEKDTFRVNTTSFWEPWSGYNQYWLNDSLSLVYTQNDLVSRKYAVFDNETESWVELEWNDSYWRNGIRNDMNYNLSVNKESEYNAPVELLLSTGSLSKNDMITTNFKWADAIKQNFALTLEDYDKRDIQLKQAKNDSYENGAQYYYYNKSLNIVVNSNKKIYVKNELTTNNNSVIGVSIFTALSPKFDCFTLPNFDSFNTTICPANRTIGEILHSFVEKEIQLPEREVGVAYAISYLLLNKETGILENYSSSSVSFFEDILFRKSRIKLSSLFDIKNYNDITEISVSYPTVSEPPYCVRFPISRFSDILINVTMPSAINNYTFGKEEFIIENYSIGNSVIAHIKPYPCCGITGISLQTAEVCST